MIDPTDRGQFLNLAGLVEGGLVGVAFILGWFAGISPLEQLTLSIDALLWGILGAVPLFVLFLIFNRYPIGPFKKIKDFLFEEMGPSLAVCRWYDLVLLAMLAGIGEEMVFRGVLFPWIGSGGYWVGLIGSSLLFGLAHPVTPTYAVIATVIGVYLGWLMSLTPQPNLTTPIVTHAVYDFLAFWCVASSFRRKVVAEASDSIDSDNLDLPG